jgi:hypothetical protein
MLTSLSSKSVVVVVSLYYRHEPLRRITWVSPTIGKTAITHDTHHKPYRLITVDNLLESIRLNDQPIELFAFDIAGGEWSILEIFPHSKHLLRVKQIIIQTK